jgi:hydroxypyruvate reductase
MVATKRLREDTAACFRAALRAVEPERLVAEFLGRRPEAVAAGPVHVAAIGKAAAAMASGAMGVLGERIVGGVVLAPGGQRESTPENLSFFAGGHPIPNEEGVLGAQALGELAAARGEDELLLCLISGGGSALMTLPPETVSLADLQAVTEGLLRAGATIGELNSVRKHLDLLKGGRLAREAMPAPVLALVISDVVGDPLDVIASGPVSPDPTTFEEAITVLKRFDLWSTSPAPVRDHLERGLRGLEPESPRPGDPCFESVEVSIVGSNRLASDAAIEEARQRGYQTTLLTTTLTGEAREVGRVLGAVASEVRRSGRPLSAPACLVAAGETTVTVTGSGKGGRNQELALGAAFVLDGVEEALVASLGTDGVDGPTDAAGAVATGDTLLRARQKGLDPSAALAENDSYPFFRALGDLLVTGPTGTNVMDLQIILVG